MKGTELFELLEPDSLLAQASAEQLESITRRAIMRQFAQGDVLMHQGDVGDSLYILLSGVARVSVVSVNGREITLDYLEPGAVIGEIAVFDGAERTATVTAHQAATTLQLDRKVLRQILDETPGFAWTLLSQMARRLRQANATIEGDRAFAAGPRLARSLVRLMAKDSSGLRHDLNQTDLAHFAGMSREQINRQLSLWSDLGIVTREQGRVLIVDAEMLAEIAEVGD